MSQFVYQGPMGQGGESRALAQDQYEEDQRMLNKSQHKDRYPPNAYDNRQQPKDPFMNDEDQFAPIHSPSQRNVADRRGTVLRVSSAQKKRPPAQGIQGYEEEEQRPTLKYDQVYPNNAQPQQIDPFNNEYPGVTPYRKSQRQSDYPRSEKATTGQFTKQKQVPAKISSYDPINVEDDEQYPQPVTPTTRSNNTNLGHSAFANPMAADSRQQIRSQVVPTLPINPHYSQPRRMTDQRQQLPEDYEVLSPRQREELVRGHAQVIQNEIESLQNESRSYRKSSPRNPRKSSPIRNKYAEDNVTPTNYQDFKAQPRPQLTDVKSIKVAKSRSNSNVRQRPQLNSYSKPLKVINAKVEQTDNELVDQPFRPHEANAIGTSPRVQPYTKTPIPQMRNMEDDDVISIQNQINQEYEHKLKLVNDEAQMKLKEVQDEHRSILQKTQELYSKKREVDDLERQFNAMNKNLINKPDNSTFKPMGVVNEPPMLHQPNNMNNNFQNQNNQSINTAQMSFLNYSRPDRQMSNDRAPHYVKSGMRPQRGRDDSRNTFQMLNELSDYDRSASRGRMQSRGRYSLSRMSSGGRDDFAPPDNMFMNNNTNINNNLAKNTGKSAMRLRDMYKEYCDAINMNKQRNSQTFQLEVNLHDVLMDLHLIGPDTDMNLQRQATEGTDVTAISTDNVRVQRGKFGIPLRSNVEHFDDNTKEDVLKNLFKILCGIMNMGLKQRGINIIDNQILKQYLDSINFNLQDNDLILLNQMATIKGLANRKAFSLSDQHLGMIHQKFKNLFEQRNSVIEQKRMRQAPPHFEVENVDNRFGGRKGSTVIMGDKSDIDRYTPHQVNMSPNRRRMGDPNFPRDLQFHELEESREYRQSRAGPYDRPSNKPYVKSKRPPMNSNTADRRQDMNDDPIERYRPIEYRRPEKKMDEEEPTFVEDDDQYNPYFKPQRPRPSNRNEFDDPRYMDYNRPPKQVKSKRDKSVPRSGRSSSMIGRGSHNAPEVSPRRRNTSPQRLDNIQDFLNSKPNANSKRTNPNVSGIGRQFKDVRTRSGAKDPRYQDEEYLPRGSDPRGSDPRYRDTDPRGSDPRYRDSDPRGSDPRYRDQDPRGSDPRYRDHDPRSGSRGGYRDSEPRGYRDSDPRGGRYQDPRDRDYKSPDRYSDFSGSRGGGFNPRNMNHGGYNL